MSKSLERRLQAQASHVINRSEVRRVALAVADTRAHKFTRVSDEYVKDVEARVISMITRDVRGLPSTGKTIYPAIRTKTETEDVGTR